MVKNMSLFVTFLVFLLISLLTMASSLAKQDLEIVHLAQTMLVKAKNWAQVASTNELALLSGHGGRKGGGGHHGGLSNNISTEYESSLGRFGCGHGKGGGGHHGDLSQDNNTLYNNTNVLNNINNSDNKNNDIYYYYQRMAMDDCAKLYDQAEPRLARLQESAGNYSHEDGVAWLSGAITSHRTCLDGLKERGLDEEVHPMLQNLTMVLNEALALRAKKQRLGSKPKAKVGN